MDEAKLEALFVGNELFEKIEQRFGVFCPFEAVGMERQEVRHAHFLRYCLDPQRPHGFGTDCLRALMRAAAVAQQDKEDSVNSPGIISLLDVHVLDLDGAELRREWQRIDLLAILHKQKLVIAIELKIDASEHSGQLGNYRTRVLNQWPACDGWNHIFLFLTKEGVSTSEDGAGWLPLSLKAVANEFDSVVRRQSGQPEARSMLIAYLAMLRRNILTNERLSRIAAQLWAQHEEALEFLMDNRPEREMAFGAVALSLFGDSPRKFSHIELAGHDVVFHELKANRVSFLPASWVEALGGTANLDKWDGCQNWWAEFPLIVWLQLDARKGGAGKLGLYAEVGRLKNADLRKKIVSNIKLAAEANDINCISFQKRSEKEGAMYSKFLKNNIFDIDDVSNEGEIREKLDKLLNYILPVLDRISYSLAIE